MASQASILRKETKLLQCSGLQWFEIKKGCPGSRWCCETRELHRCG